MHVWYMAKNKNPNGFLSILLIFYHEVLIMSCELFLDAAMLAQQVSMFILQVGYSVDVPPVDHRPVKKFRVLFPFLEPLHS